MDVNLIGSKPISLELVRNILVVPPRLLDVSKKLKLNVMQNLILSIHSLLLIETTTIATASYPTEILSIQANIRNPPDGNLAE